MHTRPFSVHFTDYEFITNILKSQLLKNKMKIIEYICKTCGRECIRVTTDENSGYGTNMCFKCYKKQGLEPIESKMLRLEFERSLQDKELTKNDIKGLLMEQALSDALYALKIPHTHNPFNITYPCFQNTRPDIVIKKLKLVIECKNLSKKQVKHSLSPNWLDKNIVKRPYFAKYRRKIVLFSFKPLRPSTAYLHRRGWRVYSIGIQILTIKQQKEAIGKLKQRFYWLKKEIYKNHPSKQKGQLHFKVKNSREITLKNPTRNK